MQRRQFLQVAAATAAIPDVGAPAAGRNVSANDTVRVALIGCGGRGRFVARHMRDVAGVEFTAVCDVYERNRELARKWAGGACVAFADFREVLDRPDVDAVLVATPDHWHAIPSVMACQAGKDVYVEKPLGHNVREGRAMIEAARRHDRIVQTGTQQRSAGHFETMREIVQSGRIGHIHYVRIWNYRNIFPEGVGQQDDSPVPAGLDWEMYLGPAPMVPFNRNRFLNRFRWFWDYAGGITTDWGTHRFDSMLQIMGEPEPKGVSAVGGRYRLNDGGEVPDVMQVTYEFPGFILSYEAHALNAHGSGPRTKGRAYYGANGVTDRPNGLAFYGTNGTMFADRLGFEVYPELQPDINLARLDREKITQDLFRMEPSDGFTRDSTFAHAKNFIECIRARSKPAADVEIGHRASTVAHLGNIAVRTGKKLVWNAEAEQFPGEPKANELLGRAARKPWDLI